ncbi:MAG: UDP-N-acetylglucosamine 1-carboxyvinyltransferase, partial [Alphaproteobacteria bacterium]|nr:UDP-N-acetylglucosamine 1-carboxyvinyltransferase [Alphaproteobacteria bacterium]
MKKLVINGGKPLFGEVQIAGAKNATLPLMVASILSDEKLTLTNLPHVSDISTMANLLVNLGVKISLDGFDKELGNQGRVIILDGSSINNPYADYDLVRKMRASIFILGPLLARCGKAKVSLPGGCAIGTRPVDLHLKALEALGAKFELSDGYVEGVVPSGRLQGAEIHFEKISVGATENAMMAGC